MRDTPFGRVLVKQLEGEHFPLVACDPLAAVQVEQREGVGRRNRTLEVCNKIDALDAETLDRVRHLAVNGGPRLVSAATGEGIDALLAEIEARISGAVTVVEVSLDPDEHGRLDWFYSNGRVRERTDREDGGIDLVVELTEAGLSSLRGAKRAEERSGAYDPLA